jgi:hypothetical protein
MGRIVGSTRDGVMALDEPEGWRILWESAQREKDPQKLALLIDQLNQLLTQHEKAARELESPSRRAKTQTP